MAEVQTSTNAGEMTQRFIEFVMMHAQNAALFLGQIPSPQGGRPEINLEVAKMFIDQLAMIQEKTRGNLTSEESTVLRNALANLQLAFVEVAEGKAPGSGGLNEQPPQGEQAAPPPQREQPAQAQPQQQAPSTSTDAEGESRKKFSKSYGA